MCLMHWMLCTHIHISHRTMRNQPPGICLGLKIYWRISTIQQSCQVFLDVGWDNLYLVRGLKVQHMRRRVASKQDSWRTMEDVFNTINHIAKMEDRSKLYFEPNFELLSQVAKEWVQEVSKGKYLGQNLPIKPIMAPVTGCYIVLDSETGAVVDKVLLL